ncbi:sigma-54-dependent Fis family transcriptional regulator [Duncaniella sp. C9]|uniref:sigma-54-dependent transcriptional regulator n=1 Tax=Bacteroidales TaxID=171549 RepID=UPI0010A37397|nr:MULTISPECIES: sigma 54-interacting transcriptional regulator [Bacteroidales]QCD38097.1 sigma-54-dependent Fis family transcriptional regulator [Duncaniella sp. C9]QCP71779.1 sigma-54-dependent Fis family transcriptional regulator [Duncaniella sp. B8]
MARQILIIDDNVSDSNEIKRHLSGLRAEIYQALRIGMAKEDLTKFNKGDIVICDVKLPDGDAVELMEWLDKKNIRCSVFVVTDVETVADAVASFRAGAKDYVNKRLIGELLLPKIKALFVKNDVSNFPLLFSRKSDGCLRAYSSAHRVAPTNLNVLIIGESGVGKEPLAQEIYDLSTKSDKPCVLLDCGTLHYLALNHNSKQPMSLLDVVASQFHKVQGGTVILDNVQLLSPDMQSIILHVLANSKQDTRIIATATPNITELVAEESFLSALFYKIKEFTITLPPLRECQDDIPLLADFYLRHYNNEFGKNVKRFDNSAQKAMRFHLWPGNIRELRHVVRVAVLKSRGDVISKDNLELDTPASSVHMNFRLDDSSFEKAKITAAIAHTGGNMAHAAKLLGICEKALWAKRKKYGLK